MVIDSLQLDAPDFEEEELWDFLDPNPLPVDGQSLLSVFVAVVSVNPTLITSPCCTRFHGACEK